MLGLSLLTAGTLAAGATGTFAWFTTNKTASATYSKIIAKSTTGSLGISMHGITESGLSDGSEAESTEARLTGTTSYTTDVSSGDGVIFAQPKWKTNAGNDKPYYSVTDVSSKTGYFTQFYITLQNNGGAKVTVYLDTGTKVSAATSGDSSKNDALASWTRVAVNNLDQNTTIAASGTKIFGGTKMGDKYVAPTTSAGEALTLEDLSAKATVLNTFSDISAGAVDNQKLFDLEPDAYQNVGVSVWMEGTASTSSQDSAKGGIVDVALNFYAVEA
jgi:hypothetical protein